jgi:UDP-N-acetylglucosamine 2-epimerase (non-hydrolysing)
MKTILSILGTRPEAIKMAPVIQELARHPDEVTSVVCVTGQHRQMVDQILPIFAIRPDVDLNIMQVNQTLCRLTGDLFHAIEPLIAKVKPDWILAQGDTTTVLVAALAAFYTRTRFGHIEAGLRTGNLKHPFPEEMNRRAADIVSDLYFAPTERNRTTLLAEGCDPTQVIVTGNTVIDALAWAADLPYDWSAGPLGNIPHNARLVTVTAHRRENFGGPFQEICLAIKELAGEFKSSGVHFVYPVHLNPNVQQPVYALLEGLENVHLIQPLEYLALINLMKRSELILTDSGGIQEEAPSFKVPVLVMRETTERPEAVEAGAVRLVGTDRGRIVDGARILLTNVQEHQRMRMERNPYGDGRASQRVVSEILKYG